MKITQKSQYIKSIETETNGIFLEPIPDYIHKEMLAIFADKYHFQNGERMQIANYYVGISDSVSANFIAFIDEMMAGLSEKSTIG